MEGSRGRRVIRARGDEGWGKRRKRVGILKFFFVNSVNSK